MGVEHLLLFPSPLYSGTVGQMDGWIMDGQMDGWMLRANPTPTAKVL
jgi:hypothetical protein